MQRHFAFWLAVLAATVAALYLLSDVLLPFVAGFALAYLLDPVADRLERAGIGRLGATLVILVVFVLVLVVALVLLIPLAVHQLAVFVERLPATLARLQELIAVQG